MYIEAPFFMLGLALLLVHELDAVRCHEWRMFPGLFALSDRWALQLPCFATAFMGNPIRPRPRSALSTFTRTL